MRRTRALSTLLLLTLLASLTPASASAQGHGDDKAVAQAKKFAKQGDSLFSIGMFKQAAAAYQKAYVAKQVPALLYNIGQCFKRLGGLENLEKALFYYESYLNNVQAAKRREKLATRISKLKVEIKRLRDELNRPPPIYKRWWFWTAIGAVVTGATIATIVALQPQDQVVVKGTVNPDVFELP